MFLLLFSLLWITMIYWLISRKSDFVWYYFFRFSKEAVTRGYNPLKVWRPVFVIPCCVLSNPYRQLLYRCHVHCRGTKTHTHYLSTRYKCWTEQKNWGSNWQSTKNYRKTFSNAHNVERVCQHESRDNRAEKNTYHWAYICKRGIAVWSLPTTYSNKWLLFFSRLIFYLHPSSF